MFQNLKKKQKDTQTTCIQYLNSFKQTELLDLQNLVSCDYFNTDKSIVLLLKILIEKVVGKETFDNEMQLIVYDIIFECKKEKQSLNQKQKRKLHNKLNTLTRLIENYIVLDGIKDQKAYQEDLLLKKIKEKKLYGIFQRKISRSNKLLTKEQIRNKEYYYRSFIRELHVLDFQFIEGILYENKEYGLDVLNNQLDLFYILNKLNLKITMLTLEKTTKKKFDDSTFDSIASLLNLPQYINHAVIKVYNIAIEMLKTKNVESYQLLQQLLIENASLFERDDLIGFYDLMANFCIYHLQKGIFKHKEMFLLFKTMDNHNLVASDEFSLIMKLKNMVAIACKVNEFEWAKDIIEKYTPYIRMEIRDSVKHLNLGAISFYQKNYENALSHSIKVDTINTVYDKSCRF